MYTVLAAHIIIPYYAGRLISDVVHGRGYGPLLSSAAVMAGLAVASGLFDGVRKFCFCYANSFLAKQLRLDLFKSLVEQEIGFFDAVKTGAIVSRLTSDCEAVSDTLSSQVNIFLRITTMLIGSLMFMLALSWRLCLVAFIGLTPFFFFNKKLTVIFDKLSERLQATIAHANQAAEEVF